MYTRIKYSIGIMSYTSWCGIGFLRGINDYKYNYNKYDKTEPYMYSNSICYGFFGMILYANPAFMPITIYREIYRLEINLRNMEDEKKNRSYNDII